MNGVSDESSITAVVVAYGVDELNLGTVPIALPVLVVHNDALLNEGACGAGPRVHIYPESNIGFGKAVNLALREIDTSRILLLNPDTELSIEHWQALQSGEEGELVTVRMVDATGRPMTSAFKYPSAIHLLAEAVGAVRFIPRGSLRRRLVSKLLGSWGVSRQWSVAQPAGRYPLSDWWASAAILSIDTQLLKQVGGFDPGYFLYFEDTDLSATIARAFPSAFLTIADTEPALHRVGGSARSAADRQRVASERLRSARHFVAKQRGLSWRTLGFLMAFSPRPRRQHGRRS